MSWNQIASICHTQFERFDSGTPPLSEVLGSTGSLVERLIARESETDEFLGVAIRTFAETGTWPHMNPTQRRMLALRLEYATSVASLLSEQPGPCTDSDDIEDFDDTEDSADPEQREQRLRWLLIFAWEQEGFSALQKIFTHFDSPKNPLPPP